MKKLSQKALANLVSARRKALGITQQQLAERTGINRAMLSHIETEEYVPSIAQLQALGEELHFDLEDVFLREPIGAGKRRIRSGSRWRERGMSGFPWRPFCLSTIR